MMHSSACGYFRKAGKLALEIAQADVSQGYSLGCTELLPLVASVLFQVSLALPDWNLLRDFYRIVMKFESVCDNDLYFDHADLVQHITCISPERLGTRNSIHISCMEKTRANPICGCLRLDNNSLNSLSLEWAVSQSVMFFDEAFAYMQEGLPERDNSRNEQVVEHLKHRTSSSLRNAEDHYPTLRNRGFISARLLRMAERNIIPRTKLEKRGAAGDICMCPI